MTTRRSFLGAGAALAVTPAVRMFAAKQKLAGMRFGVTDWDLKLTGKVEALALAKSIGFEGVEVSLGRQPIDDKLPLADADLQARYIAEAKKLKMRIAGTCLDILHTNYLKNDALGRKWLEQSIPITQKLDARVVLLPFFGKGALKTAQEMDYVADILKEMAPEAAKAKVLLGLENTISAEDNARILDRVNSKAVFVYYDVGNSTHIGGFDVVKEIRWLGKDRIRQVHIKDRGYLGEGKIDFPAVMRALADIDFSGFANLETSSPSGSVENDMRKNLAYIRKVTADVQRA